MNITAKKQRLLSIDPSINNCGVAVWDLGTHKILLYRVVHPHVHHRNNEFEKSWSMLEQMKVIVRSYLVNHIICEVPEHWSVAGFHARETGSMTKLMFLVGLLYSLKWDVEEYRLVVPREWKGQLSKEVMCNRLHDDYLKVGIDLHKINDNVADAIGIGHFYIYGRV